MLTCSPSHASVSLVLQILITALRSSGRIFFVLSSSFNVSSYSVDKVSSTYHLILLTKVTVTISSFILRQVQAATCRFVPSFASFFIHIEFEYYFKVQKTLNCYVYSMMIIHRVLGDDNKELFRRSRCICSCSSPKPGLVPWFLLVQCDHMKEIT